MYRTPYVSLVDIEELCSSLDYLAIKYDMVVMNCAFNPVSCTPSTVEMLRCLASKFVRSQVLHAEMLLLT